jgi:hypothetical protein
MLRLKVLDMMSKDAKKYIRDIVNIFIFLYIFLN